MSKLFALIRATLLSPKNLKFLTFFVVSASIMLAQVRICDYLEEISFDGGVEKTCVFITKIAKVKLMLEIVN